MTLRFLLDTNALSEPLRRAPNRNLLSMLERHQDVVATAAPVWHELVYGSKRLPESKKRRAIEKYLYEVVRTSVAIFPYDIRAAEWHAMERARLARLGKTPSFIEGQIASIAKVNDLVLITSNVQDYLGFHQLQVRDWRS